MRRFALAALVAAMGGQAFALDADAPEAGHDYYSWQIATGQPHELQKLFRQYRDLPFVRVERRGTQHVLRAGFWASASAARAALAQNRPAKPLVRVATYRPQAIVDQNWQQGTLLQTSSSAATSAAPTAAQPAATPPPAVAPSPLVLSAPSPVAIPDLQPTPGTLRPFNQEDYALAFTVFLGNRDLARALRVASEAVRSVPTDLDWRRKLARLANSHAWQTGPTNPCWRGNTGTTCFNAATARQKPAAPFCVSPHWLDNPNPPSQYGRRARCKAIWHRSSGKTCARCLK